MEKRESYVNEEGKRRSGSEGRRAGRREEKERDGEKLSKDGFESNVEGLFGVSESEVEGPVAILDGEKRRGGGGSSGRVEFGTR